MKNYELGKKLYESSQSEVFWANEISSGMPVILKFLHKLYPADEEISRFKQEFEITKTLTLSCLRKIHRYEQVGNKHCLVLEAFKGISLNEYQHEVRNLTAFLECAVKVCEALAEIHEAGIIHRDIKPANILISDNRKEIKIIDFELASRIVVKQQHTENLENLEGTLAYISPEQTGRVNHPVDVTSDLYSLGISFYELLTGKKPFQANDAIEWVHKHLTSIPTAPSDLLNSKIIVPPVLSDIIIKLLEKNPDERYQTGRGLLHDLNLCLENIQQTGTIREFILAKEDIAEKLIIAEKLYGREAETKELLDIYQKAAKGAVAMVSVSGYSGIGKSALVRELNRPITATRGVFLQGKFDQFQQNVPYRAIISCLNDFASYLLGESEEALQLWKNKITTALGDNVRILVKMANDLSLVLGEQQEPEAVDVLEEQHRFTAVLRQFIRVISQAEHPLTLFLDDLQWADRASLKLLQILATDLENEYLLIIGAYRHNEVDEAHPLRPCLSQIEENNPNYKTLFLKALSEKNIADMIADSLHTHAEKVQELADIIGQKTQGNPFFVRQLIRSLYEKDYLYFARRVWHWKTEEIRELNVSENVVDLLTEKFESFSEASRLALRVAACLGNTFSLRFLSQLLETNQKETLGLIWQALSEGLIYPLSQSYRFVTENTQHDEAQFRFLHDRVQQACMEGLSAEKREQYFLKIARLGLKNDPKYLEEWLLDLTNYYNQALDWIDEEEKQVVAELNFRAMTKAKRNIAYDAALIYAQTGLFLLGDEAWKKNYALCLQFNMEIVDCLFFIGLQEESKNAFDELITADLQVFDLADCYTIRILNMIQIGQFVEAIHLAYKALAILGVDLPAFSDVKALQARFATEYGEYKTLMQGRSVASLINLPEMTDEKYFHIIKIINQVIFPAYVINPMLYALIAIISAKTSIKHGNCAESILGYAFFQNILSMHKEFEDCYEMGQMTLRLAGKYKIHKHDCKANYLFAVAASFLKDHLSIDLSYYQKAVEIGIQTGDLLFSGIALSRLSVNEFILGIKLDEIQKSSDFRFRVLHKGGSPFAFIEFFMQGLIRGLSDPTAESPCVLGQDENSEKGLIEAWEQANFGTGVTIYRFYKMQALYHFGKYEEALEEAEKGYAGLQFIATIIEEPIFLFFHVLCIAANYENMSQDAKNIYFELIGSHISRMKLWAEHCPANFEQLLCGMRAEKARLEGNNFKAMELYRKAINLSRKNAFINFEAIMCELAARFYHKAEFPRIARTFFTEAHYIYTLWGAHGKAQWLLAVYPDYIMYLNNRSVSSGSSTQTAKSTSNLSVFTGITQHETMDLASLMKSSQLISSEVRMEALLGNLLKVVMENAGAQKGYLMLVNQENVLRIQAESTSEKSVLVLQDKPLNSDAQLPVTLVRYCERTKTPFVTDDLSKENQFIKDNYVNTVKPLSALCVPVLNQGTLKAVIYLENSLITGAFNAKRITLVNLLVGQIATSLENALLYAGLEERVQARTHELNAANELLKVQHQRIADSIRYAQTMQNSILPTDEDLSGAFAEHFAIFRPKDVVSGDFYWYAHIGNQHILAVADCTGHGVPGAFMSMVGNSALDEIIKVKEITNPSLILDMLQNSIQEALRQRTRDGMDIAIMVCEQHDENTVKILFSAAKNSLLYWENNKIVRLKGTRRSLGGGASNTQTPFELHELFLPKGTQLYLTTDGFPDQCDSNRNSFKMARLIEMLESYQAFPLKEQARFFENTLNQFMGDEEQRDDITLVGLKL